MSSRRTSRLVGFVAATALLGAACGGGSDTTADSAAPTPSAESADGDATPLAGVPDILSFTGSLVGGGELDAADLSDKPTAFWFWSPT